MGQLCHTYIVKAYDVMCTIYILGKLYLDMALNYNIIYASQMQEYMWSSTSHFLEKVTHSF